MTTATSKKAKTVADLIADLNPCDDALEWASKYPATAKAKAWVECERGDHLLWLIGKIDGGEPESDERKKLVRCACECARLALPYTKDSRVLRCIETAERWTNGEATIEEARKARAAAYDAYDAANAAYDAYAAASYAAANAANAAYDAAANAAYDAAANAAYAAYAAYDAANAAANAAYDAYDAANAAIKMATLRQCAEIVRKHYPKPPTRKRTVWPQKTPRTEQQPRRAASQAQGPGRQSETSGTN